MRVTATAIPDVLIIEPVVFRDVRGSFAETFHAARYQASGIRDTFVQDNQSESVAGTIRGLHLQLSPPQAKLVRVVSGEIVDVVVDVRRGSPTFGKWVSVVLSADNWKQCYVPAGCAHGFAVTSERALVEYKCSDFYNPHGEIGLSWNDPQLGVAWPFADPILSERDRSHPTLASISERLPTYRTEL